MNDQAIRNRRLAIQTAIQWYGRQCASNVAAAYEREAKGIAGHDDIAARKRGDQHATNALREAMALVSDLIFELQEDTNEEAPTSRTIRGSVTRLVEERCISELLEAINTDFILREGVRLEIRALTVAEDGPSSRRMLPEWLQEVFGGEA